MRFEHALVWMKPGYLGDAVMAAPLLDALEHQAERVTVLAGATVQALFADRGHRLHFLRSGAEVGFWGPVRGAPMIRALGADVVFLLNRSFRSALGAKVAGLPVRVGHATDGRALLLSHPVPYDLSRPEVECGLDLLRTLGLDPGFSRPQLTVSPVEVARGRSWLDGAAVGLQPGASYIEKQLPLHTSAELVRRFHADGMRVALFGGPEERASSEALQQIAGVPLVDLVGRTTLREAMAAASCLRLMVGADTGFLHVAAAVGCPTVTVFGPNRPEKWGHGYEPHRVLRAPDGDMRAASASAILQACGSALGLGQALVKGAG